MPLASCRCAAAGSPEGHRPARLDHIWSTGRATAAELALTDTGRGCSFSDHLAVKATITIRSSGSGSDIASTNGGGSKAGGDGEQQQPGLAPAAAALQLMRQFPEPFQEAAAQIEVAVAAMARGRSLFVRLAAGLWAASLGCLGALAVRPWAAAARPADEYLLLLGGMGVGLGWAGEGQGGPLVRMLWAAAACICHPGHHRATDWLAAAGYILTAHAVRVTASPCRRGVCRGVCGARHGAAGAAAGGGAAAGRGGRRAARVPRLMSARVLVAFTLFGLLF